MLEIVWIRHGETVWNADHRWQGHSDVKLSSRGQQQARLLAPRLARERFDTVFCSDLSRAVDTATLALPGSSLSIEPRLREIHFGEFEGKNFHELSEPQKERFRHWRDDPAEACFREGESVPQLIERVESWRRELPAHGRFAVFSHSAVIRCIVWEVIGYPTRGRWTLEIDFTGISEIHYGPERTQILTLNSREHLFSGNSSPACEGAAHQRA